MSPLVSVVMITYGHEKYIEESINGVLSQILDAEIELIISDDRSPDNTENIVKQIITNHPNGHWIKYVKHTENKGAIPNFAWTISQTTGKYIAICEGDDYWTAPLKLQKQIDFLENNLDYSIVFHKVQEVDPSGAIKKTILNSPDQEETYDLKYLAKGNFIHTPSVVFRKNFDELPAWISYSPLGDYPLNMLNAEYGLIKYLPNSMAVYRVGNGIWSSQNRAYQLINTMFTIKLLVSHFSKKEEIKQILTNQYNGLLEALSSQPPASVSPETAAYNLSFKKLFTIIARKIKYSIK